MAEREHEATLILPARIRVLMPNHQVEEMKLETYLAGAIAAQMGLAAPLEAFKAQAVASRTYVAAARRHPEHDAHVCITAHCQKWKRVDPVTAPEVFRALGETWGLVAMDDQRALINAFFFEHCDGHTRNSEAMLMPAFSYLRGVDCACGFLTLKGHGVGMCMRGAVVMARHGASFEQILQHYYRGIQIVRIAAETPRAPHPVETTPPRAPEIPRKPAKKVTEPAKRKVEREPRVTKPRPIRPARVTPEPITPTVSEASQSVEPPVAEPPTPKVEPIAPAEPVISAELPAREEPTPIEPMVSMELPAREEPAPVEPIVSAELPAREEPTPIEPVVSMELPAREEPAPVEPVVSMELPAREEPVPIEPIIPAELPVQEAPSMEPVNATELPALEEEVVHAKRAYQIDQLPGARMIAGALTRAGIPIAIQDAYGDETIVVSGSAPDYGAGGFEAALQVDGVYLVIIEGQTLTVHVSDETVFISAG